MTSVDTNYTFTGREDDGNGLMYYRNRYYSPTMKRFISEDPIGLNGGINQYAYVGGNSLMMFDPLGLVNLNLIPTDTLQNSNMHDIYDHINPSNVFSIAVHGNRKGVGFQDAQTRKIFNYSAEAIYAQMIENGYVSGSGMPIMIYSCDAAFSSIPQQIANLAHAPVTASIGLVKVGFTTNILGIANSYYANVIQDQQNNLDWIDKNSPYSNNNGWIIFH